MTRMPVLTMLIKRLHVRSTKNHSMQTNRRKKYSGIIRSVVDGETVHSTAWNKKAITTV